MPHAVRTSEIALEKAKTDGRIIRICWETNGYMKPQLLERAVELSLESGGNIKFDLKCWDDNLAKAICGVSNKPSLENFKIVGDKFYRRRPGLPVLTASTLLVPGYVDVDEVRNLSSYVSRIDVSIPYTLLAFAPMCEMRDLPTTRKEHAYECLEAAKEEGLQNVRIGNLQLLS
jgi:pyruvate formate lyase activating enzyme